jgi:hypothetical protein
MEIQIYSWLHLTALALYVCSTAWLAVYVVPSARRAQTVVDRARRAADYLRFYDPLSLAALGVLVMTGAFSLTSYKDALRAQFFERMGVALAWKLFFSFLLIILAAYISFGLGHRLVARVHLGEFDNIRWIDSALWRVQVASLLALVLCVVAGWYALRMTGRIP